LYGLVPKRAIAFLLSLSLLMDIISNGFSINFSHFQASTIILPIDKAPTHIAQDIDHPENITPIY
jgi:hypothetical protein